MNWFKDSKTYQSEKNDIIVCNRFFGTYSILVGGFAQTAPYSDNLWKNAIKKLPKLLKVKNVLVLGYGGGGIVKFLHKNFPNVQITAIEWDKVMVEIADLILNYKKCERPEIIIGDVRQVLPKLNKSYDLIVVDLFEGALIHQDFFQSDFISQLSRLLKPKGALLLNASKKDELIDSYKEHFSCHKSWSYKYSCLAMFQHFGQGMIGDPLPAGYLPRFESWEYVQRNKPAKKFLDGFVPVKNTAIGVRWFSGLFNVEKYRTDSIPTPEPLNRWRVALWYPYSNMTKPKGWHVDWTHIGTRQTGVAILNPSNYQEYWSENLKRQLKKWRKQEQFEVVEGSVEEMVSGVKNRRNKTLSWATRADYAEMVKIHAESHRELLKIWLVKDRLSKEVAAGLAVIDIPETKTSLHFMAFHYRDVDCHGGGTALIDLWYRESIKQGYNFLDFDLVWTLGDPPAWRGYSRFKKQFGLYLIKYPDNWFKIIPPDKTLQ